MSWPSTFWAKTAPVSGSAASAAQPTRVNGTIVL
jgi:hypothetical protein